MTDNKEITTTVSNFGTVQHSLYDMRPRQMLAYAAEMATPLADIIKKQKLFHNIQGKNGRG